MQRLLLAIIAAVLVIAGVAMMFSGNPEYSAGASICLRSGLVLGALSLALPQVMRLLEYAPPWFLLCMAIGLLVVIRWPRSFPIVVPVLAALWFLGPRTKKPLQAPQKAPRKQKRKARV